MNSSADTSLGPSGKPLASLPSGGHSFFASLADGDDINILGHSRAKADFPYLEEVIDSTDLSGGVTIVPVGSS